MNHLPLSSRGQRTRGSSVVLVLVLITVLSMVFGLVLVTHLARHRLIGLDVHRLQARYAAEAAVYVALDSLQCDPAWRPTGPITLPGNQVAAVTVATFGGFLVVDAVVHDRQVRAEVRALIGQVPTAPFEQAVYLWDADGRLSVAGTTQVTGDIVVGGGGVQAASFRGRRFRGRLAGTVQAVPGLAAPAFDDTLFQEALAAAARHLAAVGTPSANVFGQAVTEKHPVYLFEGDVRLTAADSLLWATPATVVVTGNLQVEGAVAFQQGTTLIAGQTLGLRGAVRGQGGLFIGVEAVAVTGPVRCAGQFLSRKQIRVAGTAHLLYPSVLFVAGEREDAGGGLLVEGKAVIEGTLLHPAAHLVLDAAQAHVAVGPEAQIRGGLFNAHTTKLEGTLYGALVTHRLTFYSAPTRYVNWLKDVEIDVTARPAAYLLPLRFGREIRLDVLSWLPVATDEER